MWTVFRSQGVLQVEAILSPYRRTVRAFSIGGAQLQHSKTAAVACVVLSSTLLMHAASSKQQTYRDSSQTPALPCFQYSVASDYSEQIHIIHVLMAEDVSGGDIRARSRCSSIVCCADFRGGHSPASPPSPPPTTATPQKQSREESGARYQRRILRSISSSRLCLTSLQDAPATKRAYQSRSTSLHGCCVLPSDLQPPQSSPRSSLLPTTAKKTRAQCLPMMARSFNTSASTKSVPRDPQRFNGTSLQVMESLRSDGCLKNKVRTHEIKQSGIFPHKRRAVVKLNTVSADIWLQRRATRNSMRHTEQRLRLGLREAREIVERVRSPNETIHARPIALAYVQAGDDIQHWAGR